MRGHYILSKNKSVYSRHMGNCKHKAIADVGKSEKSLIQIKESFQICHFLRAGSKLSFYSLGTIV